MRNQFVALVVVVISLVSCSKNQGALNPPLGTEVVSAKGVEGVPKPPATCSNIIQFDLKQGKREAVPTIWTIQMTYTVKPCDANKIVRVNIEVFNSITGEKVDEELDLPLSGKQSFPGVAYGIYKAVLTVVDANTGTIIETKSASIKVAWPGV